MTAKEYPSQIPSLTNGSFTFEILCPSQVIGAGVTRSLVSSAIYDIAAKQTLSLDLPVVEPYPVECFTVTSYKVYESDTD